MMQADMILRHFTCEIAFIHSLNHLCLLFIIIFWLICTQVRQSGADRNNKIQVHIPVWITTIVEL